MSIENYDDNYPGTIPPRTITTQAAGVVINYGRELVGGRRPWAGGTENRGFNCGTGMTRRPTSVVAAHPLGIDMDLINYSV